MELGRVHNLLVAIRSNFYLELNKFFKVAVEHVFAQVRQPGFQGNAADYIRTHLRLPPRVSRLLKVSLGLSRTV